MTFDDPNRQHRRHRTPRGFGRAHSGDGTRIQGSDASRGEGLRRGHEPDTAPTPKSRPEQISGEAQRRLHAARLWIAANRPYYSKAVFSCPVIPAGTDARVRHRRGMAHLRQL